MLLNLLSEPVVGPETEVVTEGSTEDLYTWICELLVEITDDPNMYENNDSGVDSTAQLDELAQFLTEVKQDILDNVDSSAQSEDTDNELFIEHEEADIVCGTDIALNAAVQPEALSANDVESDATVLYASDASDPNTVLPSEITTVFVCRSNQIYTATGDVVVHSGGVLILQRQFSSRFSGG
jgi:hypothetical protein